MLLGINANNHDASIALVDGSNILFAGHAERYSRVKNDPHLNDALIDDALQYGIPTQILWYEQPWKHTVRNLVSGQRPLHYNIKKYLKKYGLDNIPVKTTPHHGAHAAMGYYTSGFSDAAIVVIDAIGELECSSIWRGHGDKIDKVWSSLYPESIGLFYSAITDYLGFKPNEEEYIVMGMAAFGKPKHVDALKQDFFTSWKSPDIGFLHNLHRGMKWYMRPQQEGWLDEDLAASAQAIYESYLSDIVDYAIKITGSKNIVLAGGCALNCVANSNIKISNKIKKIWVPPNPGDSGLSLGAIAYHTKQLIHLDHAFLGHNIDRKVDIRAVVEALEAGQVVGIANGRAEFGPRALGNRSLLADPRGGDVKDRVNAIKKRETFRPFAPIILKPWFSEYFHSSIKTNQDYMQYADTCIRPDEFPAICHIDETSRVQTIDQPTPSITAKILEVWYMRTRCPILLNTSLNIKGEPLVNSWEDAERFSQLHNVAVF
jgi:carbamoyltransferase